MTSIRRLSPKGAVNAAIMQNTLLAKQSLYNVLTRVGEECVSYARTNGGYMDQTGNLRSSVGYAVLDNGKVISKSGFASVKQGAEGTKQGKDFLTEIVAQNGYGLILIVVAGMNYATYVEAKSYDVISGAELRSEVLAPQLLKQLGFNVRKI